MSKEGTLSPTRTKITLVHADDETYIKVDLPQGISKPKYLPKFALFIGETFVGVEEESEEDEELV